MYLVLLDEAEDLGLGVLDLGLIAAADLHQARAHLGLDHRACSSNEDKFRMSDRREAEDTLGRGGLIRCVPG